MHITLVGFAWLLIVLVLYRLWSTMGMVKANIPKLQDADSRRNVYIQVIGEGLTTLNILLLAFFIRWLAK